MQKDGDDGLDLRVPDHGADLLEGLGPGALDLLVGVTQHLYIVIRWLGG